MTRPFAYVEHSLDLPAIRVLEAEEPVLSGLSYRFLAMHMELLVHDIPPMPRRMDL